MKDLALSEEAGLGSVDDLSIPTAIVRFMKILAGVIQEFSYGFLGL